MITRIDENGEKAILPTIAEVELIIDGLLYLHSHSIYPHDKPKLLGMVNCLENFFIEPTYEKREK